MSYTPPNYTEARAILRGLDISGSKAAAYASLGGGRTVRRYTSESKDTFTPMPYAVLYTLAHRAGGYTPAPETWREDLATLLAAGAAH